MTTFIYGGYIYDTPIFVVKALDRRSIPEAFEQLNKLRHSGYLAGFLRCEALSPGEGDEAVPMDSRGEPTPYINFVLYRHRSPVPAPKPRPRTFCPAMDRPFAGDDLTRARASVLAADPAADVVFCRELCLTTAADGRTVFDEFAPRSPYAAYYRDSFEELIFLPRRLLIQVDRPGVGADETFTVSVGRAPEARVVSDAARAVARAGSLRLLHGSVRGTLREDYTVEEVLRAFVPAVSSLGITGSLAAVRALEGRQRGVFGSVVGIFGGYGCELALVERTLERRPNETAYRLGVGVRLAADVELDDEILRGRREVRSLILPDGTSFVADVRVEKGNAFMLREQLVRLKRAAEARDVDVTAIEELLSEVWDSMGTVPGDPGSPVPDMMMLNWQSLPDSLKQRVGLDTILELAELAPGSEGSEGADLGRLTLKLRMDGTLEATYAPMREPATRALAFARATIEERNDFLPLPVDFHPWHDQALAAADAGECLDTIVVNRVGVVVGCARGCLIFEMDGRLYTPPLSSGAPDDALMAEIRRRGEVKERRMSLAEIFGAARVWHVSALHGGLLAEIRDPRRREA